MQLRNVLIVVSDIEKSKRFYTQLFGLQVLADFGSNIILSEGLVLQEKEAWETLLGTSAGFGGNQSELYFEENAMEAFVERLYSYEETVSIVNELQDQERWVIRIYDPDKHLIEVAESFEHAKRRKREYKDEGHRLDASLMF